MSEAWDKAKGVASTIATAAEDAAKKAGAAATEAGETLAAEAGATIFPIIPAFYFLPSSIEDIAREYVNRVLAHIGLPQTDAYKWKAK